MTLRWLSAGLVGAGFLGVMWGLAMGSRTLSMAGSSLQFLGACLALVPR